MSSVSLAMVHVFLMSQKHKGVVGKNDAVVFNIHRMIQICIADRSPFLIEHYLTNGGKSIPKLIVRDADGKDLFTWGPRPALAQQLVLDLNASGAEKSEVVLALQNWYNDNKREEMQQEWMRIFQTSLASATIK